ncbi:Nwd2 [Alicycliphilus sp. B1]|nr:Nwd2 [Alicycliphilus sp. B1]
MKNQTKRLLNRSVAAFTQSCQRMSYLFCSFTLTLDQWVMLRKRLSAPSVLS